MDKLKFRISLTGYGSGQKILMEGCEVGKGQFSIKRDAFFEGPADKPSPHSDEFRVAQHFGYEIWYRLGELDPETQYRADGFYTDGILFEVTATLGDEKRELTLLHPHHCLEPEIRRLLGFVQSLAICDPVMLHYWDPRG